MFFEYLDYIYSFWMVFCLCPYNIQKWIMICWILGICMYKPYKCNLHTHFWPVVHNWICQLYNGLWYMVTYVLTLVGLGCVTEYIKTLTHFQGQLWQKKNQYFEAYLYLLGLWPLLMWKKINSSMTISLDKELSANWLVLLM